MARVRWCGVGRDGARGRTLWMEFFVMGMCVHIESKVVWRVGEVRKAGIHGVIALATGPHDGSGKWRRHACWVVMVSW